MQLAPDQSLSCSRESLLDLLMQQQTHGELGVRLGFHQDLLQPLPFHTYPYHFCALGGHQAVALYLHTHGMPQPAQITVATFAAAGVNGNTPWRKELTVLPREVALLAGDSTTAMVMSNIEKGVPLEWTEANHHRYPEEFKAEVRRMVDSLCGSAWFLHLPGPARSQIISTCLQTLSREAMWSMLDPPFWRMTWEERISSEWVSACDQVIDSNHLHLTPDSRHSLAMPQYQFRVATGQRGGQRRRRLMQMLSFGASMASWMWVLRRRTGKLKFLLSAIGAAAGAPLPPTLVLALTLLEL